MHQDKNRAAGSASTARTGHRNPGLPTIEYPAIEGPRTLLGRIRRDTVGDRCLRCEVSTFLDAHVHAGLQSKKCARGQGEEVPWATVRGGHDMRWFENSSPKDNSKSVLSSSMEFGTPTGVAKNISCYARFVAGTQPKSGNGQESLYCPNCAREVNDPLTCGDCSAVICRRCGTPLESADELGMG